MFYADFVQFDSLVERTNRKRIFIAVEAPSISVAVLLCEAFAHGYHANGGILELENIVSSKPRGKQYFKFSDADAIRRGLAI